MRPEHDARQNERRSTGRADGELRSLIPRNGRPVYKGVLVRMVVRPPADGMAHRSEAPVRRAARGSGSLSYLAQGVVGLDDEGGEQIVTGGEIAIHRGRRHAELSGHGPQRQRRSPFGGQLTPGLGHDVGAHGGLGPVAGHWRRPREGNHESSLAQSQSSSNYL